MSKIDTSSWKKFKISDLFGKAKLGKYHSPETLTADPKGYEYICASNLNNGVNKDLPRVTGANLQLTAPNIIAWGKQCPMFTYHKDPCVTSQGMYYIKLDKLSEACALFIITLLEHACKGQYGYNNCLIGSKFDEIEILLPVTSVEQPDWDYMQERIAELEQERIAELEQYLVVTGLNDYTLTDEDIKTLSLSDGRHDKTGHLPAVTEVHKEMRAFQMKDLFSFQTGDVDLQQDDINGKGHYFINSGLSDCGIKGKTDRPAKIFPANTISIDFWGNAFYRDFEYKMATHNHVFSLNSNVIKNREIGLYLVSRMSYFPNMFSYTNMGTRKKIGELMIMLPIQTDTNNYPVIDTRHEYHPDGYIPDWNYMTAYIHAIEKLVIKDVADRKAAFIAKAKEIKS